MAQFRHGRWSAAIVFFNAALLGCAPRSRPDTGRPLIPANPIVRAVAPESVDAGVVPDRPTPAELARACEAITSVEQTTITEIQTHGGAALTALGALPPWVGQCFPTHDGAWGVVLRAWCAPDPAIDLRTDRRPVTLVGRWSLVFAKRDGTLVDYQLPEYFGTSTCGGLDYDHPGNLVGRTTAPAEMFPTESPTVFDLDGDGREEFIVPTRMGRLQDHPEISGIDMHIAPMLYVVTFVNGEVKDYPAAAALGAVGWSDFDRDGRPDLEIGFPYADFSEELLGEAPLLFARSQPDGTFAVQDPLAVQHTLEQCSRSETVPPHPRPVHGVDIDEVTRTLVCLRWRGATDDEIFREVRRVCPGQTTARVDSPCWNAQARATIVVNSVPRLTEPASTP